MNSVLFEGNLVYPSKIICVGRNYLEHIHELNNEIPDDIVLFIKPNSAISEKLKKPKRKSRYEAEISFIVENGEIVGVGIGFDITLVEEQEKAKKKGLPWEKAKAFDGSAVFSKFVRIDKVDDIYLEVYKNGVLKQKADISLMIHKPKKILEEIKKYFSLYNGDIIMTGTPKGVGSFEKGDIFHGKLFYKGKLLIEKSWVVE